MDYAVVENFVEIENPVFEKKSKKNFQAKNVHFRKIDEVELFSFWNFCQNYETGQRNKPLIFILIAGVPF